MVLGTSTSTKPTKNPKKGVLVTSAPSTTTRGTIVPLLVCYSDTITAMVTPWYCYCEYTASMWLYWYFLVVNMLAASASVTMVLH